MPGILLYIVGINVYLSNHEIANVVERAGFGEIYGVEVRNGRRFNSAIVELMYWDCEEKEWLIDVVDNLRSNGYIRLPYEINGVSGYWLACRYCTESETPMCQSMLENSEMFIPTYQTNYTFENQLIDLLFTHGVSDLHDIFDEVTDSIDDGLSENDILNYTISEIINEESLFQYLEDDTQSSMTTERYDDMNHDNAWRSDFHDCRDADALTEIHSLTEKNDNPDCEGEFHPRVIFNNINLYENIPPHPIRRARYA